MERRSMSRPPSRNDWKARGPIAHMALKQQDRVSVVLFADELRATTRSGNARDHWRTSAKHTYAARDLAPEYYACVRLHNGLLPGGQIIHELGVTRMGNDPKTSVVDRWNRAHDVPNLFLVDGSSMVTAGRQQPTFTIQALGYRAADHIAEVAKRGEI